MLPGEASSLKNEPSITLLQGGRDVLSEGEKEEAPGQ